MTVNCRTAVTSLTTFFENVVSLIGREKIELRKFVNILIYVTVL